MKFPRQLCRPVGRPRVNFAIRKRRDTSAHVAVATAVRGNLGEQIYQFRSSIGMSRARLAQLMFVTPMAIYLWEHGRVEPKRLAWASFCRVRKNYWQKLKRVGKDLDGGPLMGDKS